MSNKKDHSKTNKELISELEELRQEVVELKNEKEECNNVEVQLKKKQKELEMLIDSVRAMIFYKDREGRFIRVNKALADLTGISKENWIGKTVFDLFPHTAESYTKDDEEVINSGKAKIGIVEPLKSPEGIKTVLTDKIPIKDMEGEIIGLIGLTIDISELKKAEDALKESEEKYKALFNRESESIFIYDPDTTEILDANSATSKMYGYNKDELVGMSCLKFSAEVEKSASVINKNRVEDEIKVPFRLHKEKNGTIFPVELTNYSIAIGGKKVMFCVSKNITDRKKMEEDRKILEDQLQQSRKMEAIATLAGGHRSSVK